MRVGVLGIGKTPHKIQHGKSLRDLIVEAGSKAMDDAGVTPPDIQALYLGNAASPGFNYENSVGLMGAHHLGLVPSPGVRVEAACGTGAWALHLGCAAILSGLYDTVMVMGAEKMNDLATVEGTSVIAQAADSKEEYFSGLTFPSGVALTAFSTGAGSGRLAVSNFSANTVTVFDISNVMWFVDSQGSLPSLVNGLAANVLAGQAQLILTEEDFEEAFPLQRQTLTAAPGPPILGTINTGIGPTAVDITGLPGTLGLYAPPNCFSPIFFSSTIVANANAGESTVDFTEVTNLQPNEAITPDLRGVNTSSQPTDMTYAPPSLFQPANIYFFIAGVGGTIELFATGSLGGEPSVRPDSSGNFAPNKIINTVGGLQQPNGLQWITSGLGVAMNVSGYGGEILVAETGENRIQQIGIVAEFPNQFQALNENHASGLGPIAITGDPQSAGGGSPFVNACTPFFTTYYSANAGAGTVTSADYRGAVLGSTIPVPGVLLITSWWSR